MDMFNDKAMEKINELNYTQFRGIVDEMEEPITFGKPISVLLITDRLFGCARGASEYLQNSSDITVEYVDLTKAYDDAVRLVEKRHFDFLIIVGHLKYADNYDLVKLFQRTNKYSVVAFFALYTELISRLSDKYDIDYIYERGFFNYFNPLKELVLAMKISYDIQIYRKENAEGVDSSSEYLVEKPKGFLETLQSFFR